MSVKLLKQVASVVTLVTFIATNSVYASSDSKSIFKNKKVDYQKISNQTENIIQKKKAILSGEDAKQSESQQKEAQRILSSHLSDIALIHLPPELGRIVEVHQAEGSGLEAQGESKLIVHIQDLHTNPEAEYNLAKILELLLNDYKMGLVCSEGAIGPLDTKEIASFPDYAAREKVGKIFVNAGELTGEEYLAITKYPDIPIWGIETEDIYFKNIIDFNKIMKFNPGSQIFISQAKKALEELKVKIYTKELLDLDQKEADYKAQKLEIADYISYLTNYINKFSISSDSYKNISLLTETMSKEKTIDQLKVMNESQNVLLSLQSSLVAKSLRSDSDSLMANAQLFKDQKISPFSFYSYLKSLASKYLKDDFAAKYSNLNSFTEYLAKVNSIDSTDLFLEFENLNFEIKEAISKTEEQKTLVKALRNINFLEGFFNLKVSNEELDYYLSNKDSHKVAFFEAFLKPILKKYNISAFIDYNPSLIDPHLIELEEFYKVVKERDLAMVNNSLSEIEKRNSKVSTLIAGGFHTKGITRLLKEKGYSYIVVSPYSKTDMNEENYHFLLSGQRKPITELLNQLDVKEIINRFTTPAALRVPLGSNTTLVNKWNQRYIPDISKSTGIPEALLKLEPLLIRAGAAFGLLKKAEDWPDLPFEFIKVKVLDGQRVVFHLKGKNAEGKDRDIYFQGHVNEENQKGILSSAKISDFNQAGILRAAITPSLNLIDVQKSIAIAPVIALASNQEMSANEKIERAFVFYKAAYRNTGQMDAEGMPADPDALKAILGRPYELVAEVLLSGSDISDENLDNAITILKDAKGLLYVSDKVKYDVAERIFNIAIQRRAAAAPDRFLSKIDRIEEINGAVKMASNKGLQAEIKSLVPEIGTSEAREILRKIFTDLKNKSNLKGLSILKAELETSKRAFGYAMDDGSGGMAYVFTLTDSFLKEVVTAMEEIQTGVQGKSLASNGTINIGNLQIALGSLISPEGITKETINGKSAVFTNSEGKRLEIEITEHKGKRYAKIGAGVYLIKGDEVNLFDINPIGNNAWFDFFGKSPSDIGAERYYVDLPFTAKGAILFPANRILQPSLLPNKTENNTIRQKLQAYKGGNVADSIQNILHFAVIVGLNGTPEDYYLAQDVLNKIIKLRQYRNDKDLIVSVSDYLYLAYRGVDWDRMDRRINKLKAGDKDKKTAERTQTIYERSVESTRLAVPDLENWKVVHVEALSEDNIEYISEDLNSESVREGDKAISEGKVVSVPFMGGSATTVKKKMGKHKMIHEALKVRVQRGDKIDTKWINIAQARIGLILGQNKDSQVVVVTSVDGTEEGDSDRSVRDYLDREYKKEIAKRQMGTSIQRAGLVLNPTTGEPLKYSDGHIATCAENHLWAFLSMLMDKDLIAHLLESSDGIVFVGNGDNPLNYPRKGMAGEILKARKDGKSVATIAVCSPSRGDKKGGFAARVTYRNSVTSQEISQVEMREVSEFPTRTKEAGFKTAVDLSKERDNDLYKRLDEGKLFVEDMFGDKSVAFNVAFYAIDLKLFIARIFGFDENDSGLIAKLANIDKQSWTDRIIDLAEKVPETVQPNKEVPNENNTDRVKGYMTEQAVQDFIVNSMGLLPRNGVAPEVKILLGTRQDMFWPYKGTDQDVMREDGSVVMDEFGKPKTDYDLIANMNLGIGTVKRLAANGHYILLGENERVIEILPVTLQEVIDANKPLASNERIAANLQTAVEGDKDAYLAIKNMNPLEVITHFESGLENTIANLPEDLFGHGFGYDIRGNALKIDGGIIDMTPENLYAIGKLLALKYTKPGDKYLVTGDTRMHTPILRYAMVLGAASVGADVDFSEEELSSGAHNVYSAENPRGYKVQVQMSGSHGVFQKNGAKIKADIGNNRLDPVYGEELGKLYNDRQEILAGAKDRTAQNIKIQEVSGIENAIVDMYDKTLPKTVKDEILILDARAGGGGSLAAKLLAKREYEVIDVDEVFGILGQAADMRALLSDQDNVARLLSLLNEKWDGGKHKIVFMLNMHPDPLMRRGIWDPSKPEAMVPTVTLVKAINGNLREGMPQAIGGVYDGDADRVGAVKENGEDIPAFEMTIPYYQRFLLDPQNKAAIIQMANAGIEPLWLALDVRANSKLQNTLAKISGILKDEYEKQYKKEYSGDMLNFVYINTGYPPQLAFIAWRIEQMKKLVDSTPALRDNPVFMENFNHLIHTYYTAEASGHNFFHASPGNPERPCDCAIAAFISLINIKETMDDTEAPVLGIPKGSKTPLVTLFETFPPTITSNEIRVVIPNGVKIATAHKLGAWLKQQYGSELKGQKAEKIKIGDLEYEPAENGLVTVAGYKAQLKSGDTILIRWSNTGEQLTLLFEGHDINSLINNVETVLNRMKEEQQNVPGLKLDDLEKELAGLKQKRDSSQSLALNQTFMQDFEDDGEFVLQKEGLNIVSNEGVIQTLRNNPEWRKRAEAVNKLEWDSVNGEVFALLLKSLKDDPHPAVVKVIVQKLIFDGKIWENKEFLIQAINALVSTADTGTNNDSRVAAAISLLRLMEQFSAQPMEIQKDNRIGLLRTQATLAAGAIFDRYKHETPPINWPIDENIREMATRADKIIGDFIKIADGSVAPQKPVRGQLASNNELTREDVQRMIEGKAVPAAKVIEDKRGFKNWVDRQSNITVTIVAMTGEEYAAVNDLHGFNNGQVIVITVERAEELRAKFTEDFAIYDQNIFGSFDLNDLSVARKAVYNRELEKARTSGV